MKPKALIFAAICSSVCLPVTPAAPPFQTAAPVAYMKDLSSGAVLRTSDGHERRVWSVDVLPDGQRVLSGSAVLADVKRRDQGCGRSFHIAETTP